MVGADSDLLKPSPQNCHQLRLDYPILTNEELAQIRSSKIPGFVTTTLPFLYKAGSGAKGMALGMEELYAAADAAIARGINIIVLSDREMDSTHAPIPALLALSGLHHHLVQNGTRTRIGLIVESGEPREVHHFAALIGYGATAVNPYLAYESIDNMILMGQIMTVDREKGYKNYVKAAIKGVVKTLSKMGISTIQSYCGAQIFEAVGIHQSVIDKYFTWTPSRIGGVDLDVIAQEAQMRHEAGFPPYPTNAEQTLVIGGEYQWRKEGEYHLWNPETIYTLQQSCWNGDYSAFKQYSKAINEQDTSLKTIRGLFEFKLANQPLPLEEVEPVEAIVKRFKSGAMSFGSISKEAHETIAIAMNRLGGKSNSGEGGEDPGRFKPLPNGDSKCSAIKQVASGRFGVTSDYLMSAKELQIKLAQGAKPGEGGQLPGRKVYPWVAKERHSTPGVGLISPPPHHDIYSIEDLAELIYDLKNANREARINVKLVSEIGVGTIAAGVAKAHADVVLISGYDGGTGASPVSSIKHTGLPWELGLAETHQTLVLNNLRDRIVVETDGQLKTGRDVVVAALLGAEEYGFATTLLVTMGCVLLRACHLDTCEVGVATQNPELRKNFKGKPEYIINFLTFIAQEMREIMAQLGFRTIDEMVGRSDRLEMREAISHWKAQGLDYSELLYRPDMGDDVPVRCTKKQDHGMEQTLDYQVLLDLAKPALERGEKVSATLPIRSLNRVVGTMLGSEITRKYGAEGLPEDTIQLHFKGSAGQSFAAFVPKGLSMTLEGDSNDYLGKGLSGGKIVVYPMEGTTFVAEENIIVGNVAFYGATYGEAFIRGMAGERFCVRNSGVTAVVEGVGDHGCEYMTGGRVVVLGRTGRNFAAGMSGGVAYVLDEKGSFPIHCNQEMVSLEPVEGKDAEELKALVEKHYTATKSAVAQRLLADWDKSLSKFVKVMPKDYKRMLEAFEEVAAKGLSGEEAIMAAFELNKNDKTRVSGN